MRTCIVGWLSLTFLFVWSRVTATMTCLDDKLDVASKAYLAPIVFQGRLIRLQYSPTIKKLKFRVKKIYKNDKDVSLQKNYAVYLNFLTKNSCLNTFKIKDFQRKGKFVVFASAQPPIQPRNSFKKSFVAVAMPLRLNRKTDRTVRKILCQGCAKPPSARIHPIRVKTKLKTQFKLRCKLKGNPWPQVQWYKNKKLIKENERIQIETKRKSSVITVKRVKRRDGGWYECRATNILAPLTISKVKVVITGSRKSTKSSENSTEYTPWHFKRSPCNVRSFCLNGGTCTMIESLQERVCECADGYKGRRCEQKDTTYTFVLPQTSADIVTTTKILESVLGK
ncbi:pro-neuregulin-2, membrane-bound isoform-like [Limulus polyphemus]|uniref:Pro-neuregulin-2, membrane-bound isoform-like n=1 Tax=Limulus polyphemus TaxID=6850 RepID=A0ABM1BFX3_LIMPO|nr:pro-neuregulin-2, membrane-bound isoform-like [Limulus polyphemus]